MDTNSAYLAKFCFGLGMNLRRVEVIADDEGEIIEAVKRMSNNYDFVVTSGGIGPTYGLPSRRSLWRFKLIPADVDTTISPTNP